jgi:hypothetical protein
MVLLLIVCVNLYTDKGSGCESRSLPRSEGFFEKMEINK